MTDRTENNEPPVHDCCGEEVCCPSIPDPPSEEELAQQKAFDEEHAKATTIDEDDGIHLEWYKEVEGVRTTDDLVQFINHLLHDYNHDYGTICHAITAAAIAAAKTVNSDPRQGGITGFQASCIMWLFIQQWMFKEGPMKLMVYDQMLYPQNERQFTQTISADTWKFLQETAQEKLNTTTRAAPKVIRHWESIVAGTVPFGYTVNPESAGDAEDEEEG